jgi:predicted permease
MLDSGATVRIGGYSPRKDSSDMAIRVTEVLRQDFLYSFRSLRITAGFSMVVVLTFALGIGPNTAIFSMVNSLILRPLPVADAAQIVVPYLQQRENTPQPAFSVADYREIARDRLDVFSGLVAHRLLLDGMSRSGQAERVMDLYVSGNFFALLGIQPALGRFILPSEGEQVLADPVMVLGYSCWKNHFGGDPEIVGQTVLVDGRAIKVVGVAPEGFYGISPWANIDAYLPLGMAPISGTDPDDFLTNRKYRVVSVLGRLHPGVTRAQAEAALNVEAQRLSRAYPTEDTALKLPLFDERSTRFGDDPRAGTLFVVGSLFGGLAILVLVLACFNAANMLIVRGILRQRDTAIRLVLGAGQGRLFHQLLIEGLVLALGGGLLGTLLGWAASLAARSVTLRSDAQLRLDFAFDWHVAAFAVASTVLVGLAAALAPALRVSSQNLNLAIHSAGCGTTGRDGRLRTWLVTAQLAGAMTLLVVTGLFARSLTKAEHSDLGFKSEHVLNFSMDPLLVGYSKAQGTAFLDTLLERIREMPGVVSASIAYSAPMSYVAIGDALQINDYSPPTDQPRQRALYNTVSPDYFATLEIAITRGRAFTGGDDERAEHVAIVNEAFARRYWPNREPVGRTFTMVTNPTHVVRVVGVAADVRYRSIAGPILPYFYVPFAQRPGEDSWAVVHVRTSQAPESQLPGVDRLLHSFAAGQPFWNLQTMRQALYTLNGLLIFQLGATVAAILGGVALLLTVIGVFGLVSYDTSQRTREIGIRIALGARPHDVFGLILGYGIRVIASGVGTGWVLAFAGSKLVNRFLLVSSSDLRSYAFAGAVLGALTLLASLVPAAKATQTDPMMTIRSE